jgi:hypothetical protein
MEVENAHVDIPVWDYLFPGRKSLFWHEPNELLQNPKLPVQISRYGTIEDLSSAVFQQLHQAGCILQLFAEYSKPSPPTRTDASEIGTRGIGSGVNLSAIIYGQEPLSSTLGEWLSDWGLFLQDPLHCEKNVPYKNPHLLCEDEEETFTTFDITERLKHVIIEHVVVRPDLFELLNEENHLPETDAPPCILTPLYRYCSIV